MKKILTLLMILSAGRTMLFAQDKIVGTVLDTAGQPLMGVFVLPAGGSIAVTTDFDGRFEIAVKPGTALQFSYLGVKDKYELAENNMVVILDGKRGVRVTPQWAKKRWNNILLAEYGFNAMNMVGQSIGIRYGQCLIAGWYVGARYVTSDFKFNQSEGTLDNNGMVYDPAINASGCPIMTGISSFNQFSVSAGFLWRMGIPLYGYVGGGYGYRTTVYESANSVWLKRANDTPHLGLAELGFIGDIHYITISLGCEVIFTNTIEAYPKIGIGYTFPMKKSER